MCAIRRPIQQSRNEVPLGSLIHFHDLKLYHPLIPIWLHRAYLLPAVGLMSPQSINIVWSAGLSSDEPPYPLFDQDSTNSPNGRYISASYWVPALPSPPCPLRNQTHAADGTRSNMWDTMRGQPTSAPPPEFGPSVQLGGAFPYRAGQLLQDLDHDRWPTADWTDARGGNGQSWPRHWCRMVVSLSLLVSCRG